MADAVGELAAIGVLAGERPFARQSQLETIGFTYGVMASQFCYRQ